MTIKILPEFFLYFHENVGRRLLRNMCNNAVNTLTPAMSYLHNFSYPMCAFLTHIALLSSTLYVEVHKPQGTVTSTEIMCVYSLTL